MKICVYAIAKDEEKFVDRFMENLGEADLVVVGDTGSDDDTIKLLDAYLNVMVTKINVDPWRFDEARNETLLYVPSDYDVCVCIDLDEVITPGWKVAIEKAWTDETTRLRYEYIWSFQADGSPGVTYWADKIHSRHGYKWVKPVHEVLQFNGTETQTRCEGFKILHYPDNTKPRSSYLPLLEMGCRENPGDDRNSHYLGREYMYYGLYEKAINELQRHLRLPAATWNSERCASMRYIARSYSSLGNLTEALAWAMRACAESPGEREPWIELGKIYYTLNIHHGSYYAMKQALSITEKPMSYICEPDSWGSYPYDIASIAAFNLGMIEESAALCKKAIELNPSEQRLHDNLLLISNGIHP